MRKPSTIKIGKQLQSIRKSNGYTQEKIAEKIGVTVRYISDIEQDRAKPSYEVLVKIEAALTCGTDIKTFRRGHPVLIKTTPSAKARFSKDSILDTIDYSNKKIVK